MLWFWLITGPALVLAALSLRGERRRGAYIRACLEQPPDPSPPPVTLVVRVGEAVPELRENLASFAALDYPDYDLIVIPARRESIDHGDIPAGARVELAEGWEARTASTVHVFATAEGRVERGWLRALVRPLSQPGIDVATGYRWHAPEPPDFWSLLRGVWDAGIAAGFGPGEATAWNGALAVRQGAYHASMRAAFAPGALLAIPGHITAPEFWRCMQREMRQVGLDEPRRWRIGFFTHLFWCASMVACVIVAFQGNLVGEYVLVTQWLFGMLKGANTAALAKLALPGHKRWFDRYGWTHTWWAPLATWVWLAAYAATARRARGRVA